MQRDQGKFGARKYLNAALGEAKALLDEVGELADAATILTEDIRGLGGVDDHLCAGGGGADLESSVAAMDNS